MANGGLMAKSILFAVYTSRLVLALSLALSVSGCTFVSGPIAQKIYSNLPEVRDEEAPPTAIAFMPSSDVVAIIGGKGEGVGCSISPLAESLMFYWGEDSAPVSLQFRQACVYHDYCYRHGEATYGYTQNYCDFALQRFAYRLCRQFEKSSHEDCEKRAKVVLLGVRTFGGKSFQHGGNSTYFEFDPMPEHADDYVIGRLLKNGNSSRLKAYYFNRHRVTVTDINWSGSKHREAPLPVPYGVIPTPPSIVKINSEEHALSVARTRENNSAIRLVDFTLEPKASKIDYFSEGACNKKMENGNTFIELDYDQAINLAGTVDNKPSLVAFSHRHNSKPAAFVLGIDPKSNTCKIGPSSTWNWPCKDNKIGESTQDFHCDYYRLLQHSPLLVQGNGSDEMMLIRRGEGNNGGDYKNQASLIRFPLQQPSGKPNDAKKILAENNDAEITENDEPLVSVNVGNNKAKTLLFAARAHKTFSTDKPSATLEVFEVLEGSYKRSPHINLDKLGLDSTWLRYPVQFLKAKSGQDSENNYVLFARFCPEPNTRDCKWPEPVHDTIFNIQFKYFKLSIESDNKLTLFPAGTAAVKIDTSKQLPVFNEHTNSCETFKSDRLSPCDKLRAEQIDFVRRWRQSQIIPEINPGKNQPQETTLDVAIVFKCNTDYSLRLTGTLSNGEQKLTGSHLFDEFKFAELASGN